MNSKLPKQSLGFTIVELLIVVMLISVLGAIIMSLINSSGIRDKSYDAQRKADLGKLAAALEVYYADHRSYPSTGGVWELAWSETGALETVLQDSNYINKIPIDPKAPEGLPPSDPCDSPEYFRYNYRSDGTGYYLTAILAAPDVSHDSVDCGTLNGWNPSGCVDYYTVGFCYGLENP